jgi:hypothetical protein
MCAPLLVSALLVFPLSPVGRFASALVGIGVVFALSDWVRGKGQAIEGRLVRDWNGMPTARLLRLEGTSNVQITKRRRQNVQDVIGRSLPSRRQERDDPEMALQKFDAAIKEIIPLVRGRDKDRLLHEENVRYGFRRNLLAVRPFVIGISIVVSVGDLVLVMIGIGSPVVLVALAFSLCEAVAAAVIVRPGWVEQAATTYSERFYDALESRRAGAGRPS